MFLRDDGNNNLIVEGDTDPDCATGVASNQDNLASETTVPKLMRKAKMPYLGPFLKKVDIPVDTPRDATANPVSLLQERVRVASGYICWSNPAAVEVVQINSSKIWFYDDRQILEPVTAWVARNAARPVLTIRESFRDSLPVQQSSERHQENLK